MKTLWIVLGVLAALGIACCAGVFFMGKGVYNAVGDLTKGADEYATRTFPQMATDWDLNYVRKESSPEFQAQVTDETLKGLFKLYKEKLGKFKSVGKFTSDNFQVKSNNGDNFSLVTTKAQAEFEKGPVGVELELVKRNDTWKLLGIELKSDALLK